MSLSELGQFEEAVPGLEQAFRQSSDKALRRAAGLQLQRAYTGLERHTDEHSDVRLVIYNKHPDRPSSTLVTHQSTFGAGVPPVNTIGKPTPSLGVTRRLGRRPAPGPFRAESAPGVSGPRSAPADI